ncbi:NADP-dependent oxidoreductase [Fodinicola feengrottensis]
MRTTLVRRFGGPEVLEIATVADPEPGPGQVRVRVAGAAVNKIDISTRNGALAQAGLLAPAPQTYLGWDVSGQVDALGPGASRFTSGDAVVGLRDVLSAGGTQADYVVLDESAVAPAPTTVSLVEAAALPLMALTADRSLRLAGLHRGQTVLVTGAGGGVGGVVLQLAALRGIRTIAVADDERLVRDLGATDFVPRKVFSPAAVRRLAPGGVDAVIDAAVVGVPAHEALRGGGTFVALVAPFAPPPLRATTVIVQEVFADGGRLAELAALVDAGRITLRIQETLPLADIAVAHELTAKGGLRGKLVLSPGLLP